jgi:hypothetical protein
VERTLLSAAVAFVLAFDFVISSVHPADLTPPSAPHPNSLSFRQPSEREGQRNLLFPAVAKKNNTSQTPTLNRRILETTTMNPYTLTLFSLALSLSAFSQTTAPDPKSIPVIDGAIGACSVDFTVTDPDGAPVYAATIKVHIAYGFMYLRKLDLQVGTNADGKARFTGLPARTKNGLFFEASSGDRTAQAFNDPATTCKNQFTVTLRKKP